MGEPLSGKSKDFPVELPDGWSAELLDRAGMPRTMILIRHPNGKGMVTVDVDSRVYRFGLAWSGPVNNRPRLYEGTGWKKRLFSDAIDDLSRIYDGRPVRQSLDGVR